MVRPTLNPDRFSHGQPNLARLSRADRQAVLRDQCRAIARELRGERGDLASVGLARVRDEIIIPLPGPEYRALSDQLGPSGRYLVPTDTGPSLLAALYFSSSFRPFATTLTTTGGGELQWPGVDDTSVNGVRLAENTLMATTDVDTLERVSLFANKTGSGWLLLPAELEDDTAPQWVQWYVDVLGRRISRKQNADFLETVSDQAATGVTAASSTAIAGDEVLDLPFTLDAAYQLDGMYMAHPSIIKYIYGLKDGQGRYLFKRHKSKRGFWLFGDTEVVPNQSMPSTPASGSTTLLYGDFSYVLIRDVGGARLVYMTETKAESDELLVGMLLRSDCALACAGAGTPPVKKLVHP